MCSIEVLQISFIPLSILCINSLRWLSLRCVLTTHVVCTATAEAMIIATIIYRTALQRRLYLCHARCRASILAYRFAGLLWVHLLAMGDVPSISIRMMPML